jgi:hypothetical protein
MSRCDECHQEPCWCGEVYRNHSDRDLADLIRTLQDIILDRRIAEAIAALQTGTD